MDMDDNIFDSLNNSKIQDFELLNKINPNISEIIPNFTMSQNTTNQYENALNDSFDPFEFFHNTNHSFLAFDDNSLFSIRQNDDEKHSYGDLTDKKFKRSLDLLKNKINYKGTLQDTLIYTIDRYLEFTSNLPDCGLNNMYFDDFQLVNLGNFFNPKVHFVWFNKNHIYSKRNKKNLLTENYTGIYMSLFLFNTRYYYIVKKILENTGKEMSIRANFICNVKQFYLYENLFLIIFGNGNTFWFGTHVIHKDDSMFQNDFYEKYKKKLEECVQKNIDNDNKNLCCKNFVFGTILNQHIENVFSEYKLKTTFETCLKTGDLEKLSKSLWYDFETASLFNSYYLY
ncbi:hypothetical protein GVAV_002682 [Gurleya vavrai]